MDVVGASSCRPHNKVHSFFAFAVVVPVDIIVVVAAVVMLAVTDIVVVVIVDGAVYTAAVTATAVVVVSDAVVDVVAVTRVFFTQYRDNRVKKVFLMSVEQKFLTRNFVNSMSCGSSVVTMELFAGQLSGLKCQF